MFGEDQGEYEWKVCDSGIGRVGGWGEVVLIICVV